MSQTKSTSELKSRDDFLEELNREIARVRRYGHRITLLLIEPEEYLEDKELEEFKKELVNQLRTSDSAFSIGKEQFACILPDTHEAGGEAAALRIKRRICAAMNIKRAATLALSIGVISLDSGISQDAESLIKDLEKDLERDKRCQSVDLKKSTIRDIPTGEIIFTGAESDFIATIDNLSGEDFNTSDVPEDDIIAILTEKEESPVVIMGPYTDFDAKKSLTEKVRFNRKLNDIYVVWLQNGIEYGQLLNSCDILLPEKTSPEILWPIIRQGFKIMALRRGCVKTEHFEGILNSVSSAAHQLNQPLQIILGRLELFMLNLDDVPENREIISDVKTIRGQALLAADINKKIGRLAKYDVKSGE